jgi:hypothetical protein
VVLQPTLSWSAVAQGAEYEVEVTTDPAFSAVVYTSTATAPEHTLETGLEPETEYWWRVQATNPCGSGPLATAFSFTTRAIPPVLLVDDDDNSPDVRSTYTQTLDALGVAYDVWDTNNSDNEPDSIQLGPYSAVIWFTGEEYGGAAGPGAAAETALASWLGRSSGCLLISSQDYHYDRGLTDFMSTALGVASVDDDVSQSSVTGAGSVFSGVGPFTLSYPFTNYSDVVLPAAGAEVAFTGDEGSAAVDRRTAASLTSFWGFPFEAIAAPSERESALAAFFAACTEINTGIFADGFETGDLSRWSETVP